MKCRKITVTFCWGEAGYEEVHPRKLHQISVELSEVRVELSGEPEARCDTAHYLGDQPVHVAVRRVLEPERPAANAVERLVVQREDLVHAVS